MRILIVSQYFWPENFRINDLAVELHQRGHDVVVLTGTPNYPGGKFFPGYHFFGRRREHYCGVTVMRVPVIPRGKKRSWRLALNYLSFAFFASLSGAWRCRGKYDAIIVFEVSPVTVGIPAVVISRLTGAPIWFWVQDLWPESLAAAGGVQSPFILALVDRLVRWLYAHCHRILVQSPGFIDHTRAHGVPPEKILYFPNWAEDFYQPIALAADAPERHELPTGCVILFAGNLGAAQGLATVLAAAERLRHRHDIHWVLIGDGTMRSWIETTITIRQLTATVHLLGRRPPEAMPRYFAAADALLVTLRSEPIFALTIPGKVQSYLACGRPIIAAAGQQVNDIVTTAGAGLTCAPDDPEALAACVERFAALPTAARTAMGQRGRHYYDQTFQRQRLIDQLELWLSIR